ncbi:T-cell receptor gamma chain V region PT-gamma-1/2 [Pteropus alecto]|nr:T-cell receptor gamma chain V region PT-gamma-1/2 [Pteropus alecto]
MLWIPVLFLAFLATATQVSSNLEGRKISVTRATGMIAVFTCDSLQKSVDYIHWYRYQEGMALQHLLYYHFFSSKVVVEGRISSGKYHAYEGTGRSCKFVLRNLEESDSGVYYCAAWEKHSDSDLPRLY